MKKIILTLTTVFLSTVLMKSQEISFEKDKIDYGTVQYDSDGFRDFVFNNIGDSPLIIQHVQGQCGCTTTSHDGKPGWPQEPIMPKQKGIIRIKYDTKRLGKFNKVITVTSNDIKGTKTIFILGEVVEKK